MAQAALRKRKPRRASPSPKELSPVWDPVRRELCVGGEVVKVFRRPAPNQELILAAFEEEGWPPRIDDPLPPRYGVDSKGRLHEAIRSLNGPRRPTLIRFVGDGEGKGVMWKWIEDATPPSHSNGGHRP